MFQIHFLILENSGDGDGFMSAEFQHTLGGHQMEDTYAGGFCFFLCLCGDVLMVMVWVDVAIGSTVSIRHVNTQGGYLHSHAHNYPGGSMRMSCYLKYFLVTNVPFRATDHSLPPRRREQRMAHP